jgi:hypothetical protein
VLDRGVQVSAFDMCSGTRRETYCSWIGIPFDLGKVSVPDAILVLADDVSFLIEPERSMTSPCSLSIAAVAHVHDFFVDV